MFLCCTPFHFPDNYTIGVSSYPNTHALLRRTHFDPDTRTGTAEFWLIPGAGNEDPRRNPATRGRRTDIDNTQVVATTSALTARGTLQQRMITLAR